MKKGISIALSILLVITSFSVFSLVSNSASERIRFQLGSYPQSQETDVNIVIALNQLIDENKWEQLFLFDTGNANDQFYVYQDVISEFGKYRALKFTKDIQYSGRYTNYNYVYWFRFDPLEWILLDPETGFSLCTTALDTIPFRLSAFYNKTDKTWYADETCSNLSNDYSVSFAREWLNNDFFDLAFSPSEKEIIMLSTNENRPYTINDLDSDFEATQDRVFLLSAQEASNSKYGFSSGSGYSDLAKRCYFSDYGQKLPTYYDDVSWLLRSGGSESNAIYYVQSGNQMIVSINPSATSLRAIRPAIKVDIDSDILKEYTIEYNANGGYDAPASQTKRQAVGLILSNTVPYRDGYSFEGWSTDANAIVAQYSPQDIFELNQNTVLFAVWSKKHYRIVYRIDDLYYAEQCYEFGENIKPLPLPVEIGISYSPWTPSFPGKMPSHDLTVYSNSSLANPEEENNTPQLRINPLTNFWEVSYDNAVTWISLDVKATGENGIDGVGIETTSINDNGELIITLTNGKSFNLGIVRGKDGQQGNPGENGQDSASIVKLYFNDQGELIAVLSNGEELNAGKPTNTEQQQELTFFERIIKFFRDIFSRLFG